MALADDVTNRLSSTRLTQLTNPESPGSASVDTGRLGYAVADAEAEFSTVVGVVYDSDNARHTAIGVQLVLLFLRRVLGEPMEMEYQRLVERMRKLAMREAKPWTAPVTDGVVSPTVEDTKLPDADITRFPEYTPNAPGALDPDRAD